MTEEITESTETTEVTPLDNFWNVFALLVQDVRRCMKVFEDGQVTDKDELMFWDRVLARSVLALIEGTAYSMAWLAYRYVHIFKDSPLSASEIVELKNAYDFDDPIEPNIEINRSHLLNKIQWAFDMFARVHKVDRFPLSELTEWVLIKGILRSKEGLAHPRAAEELIVYEEHRETLIEGTKWFIEQVVALLGKCRDSMEAYQDSTETGGVSGPNDFVM